MSLRRPKRNRMANLSKSEENFGSEGVGDDDELDSDEEIQLAHAAGKLEGGLHAVTDQEPRHINNRAAIESKLSAIKLKLSWLERLDVLNEPAILAPELAQAFDMSAGAANDDHSGAQKGVPQTARQVRAQNDFERELFLYRQAQATVLESIPRLKQLGVATKRPDDYFAEMIKTDEHMQKIRQKLLSKQQEAEASEKARKLREMKKRGAQVHAEIQQHRAKEKRELLKSVMNYRKTGAESSIISDILADDDADKVGKRDRIRNGAKRQVASNRVEPGAKRLSKNKQFGYGGKMRGNKRNTRESTDAYPPRSSSTSFSRSSFATPEQVKRVRQKIQKQKRPGKIARQKTKSRR